MWRAAAIGILLSACGGQGGVGDDDDVVASAVTVPAVLDLPYIGAGAGPTSLAVTVTNPTASDAGPLHWRITGAGFTVDAPDVVPANGSETLTVRWDGAAAETIAGATLTLSNDSGDGATSAVWAVAGDPGLGDETFAPVSGAGGVTIGQSAVVSMPTAPFDGDPRVHIFVPTDYRDRGTQDVVLHFHGFSTTIDETVPSHLYREHLYASGADEVLVVPQGPVNMASGDFGRLMDPAGTQAMLDEVMVVLYRAGLVENPVLGDVTLTSHSGGYQAVAANLMDPPFHVRQVDLFDSLYGDIATYQSYAEGGGVLRSDYTASGGTDQNNMTFATTIGAVTDPTQANLRDAPAVVYYVPTTHELSTREVGAYGEQLRWGAHASRRGPRIELRSIVATAGMATVTYLVPHDDDAIGVRVQASVDGATWTDVYANASLVEGHASFPLTSGARVRLLPIVPGMTDPQPSDTYRVDPEAQVLVVDGFDRVLDGSYGGLAHDFAAIVGEATGQPVATVSHRAITDDGFELSAYRTVIWLCGDQSTADHTFTAAEQSAIDAYLAGGGHLIISGSEVGYELGGSAPGWLASTAGAVFASDNSGSYSVSGSGVPSFTYAGPSAPYAEEFPDTFTATGGGTVVLSYATGAAAAVGIAGHGVIVGFPLELIDSGTARAQVLAALIAFVS